MKTELQIADHRIIAELMENNRTFDRKDQLKGMLEDLQRITGAVQRSLYEEAKKKSGCD
jgi:hypothetical protein